MPEFLLITLLTSAEIVLSELTIHQPAQAVTDITISIYPKVWICAHFVGRSVQGMVQECVTVN